MNHYEQKRAARAERLRERAEQKAAEAVTLEKRAESLASVIPFGQPILVGHHSEGRDRNYRKKIRRTFERAHEAYQDAATLARRAESAESNETISSDDPDAIVKLRAKLAEEEAAAASFKADLARARKLMKRHGGIGKEGWGDVLVDAKVHPAILRFAVHMGSLPTLANRSANLRRIRERIAELEARAAQPAKEPERHGDVTIEEAENRVRITFPGKPSEAIRRELKSHGFRWTPSLGVWQRHAGVNAWWAARHIVAKLEADRGAA